MFYKVFNKWIILLMTAEFPAAAVSQWPDDGHHGYFGHDGPSSRVHQHSRNGLHTCHALFAAPSVRILSDLARVQPLARQLSLAFESLLRFWPVIDNQLRRLAIDKGIKVRLLVSHWKHTNAAVAPFLRSLAAISLVYPHVDIQVVSVEGESKPGDYVASLTLLSFQAPVFIAVSLICPFKNQKMFVVPVTSPDQEKIPFARVNHNKYMVTDTAAYIGKLSNTMSSFFSLVPLFFVYCLSELNTPSSSFFLPPPSFSLFGFAFQVPPTGQVTILSIPEVNIDVVPSILLWKKEEKELKPYFFSLSLFSTHFFIFRCGIGGQRQWTCNVAE